MSFFDKIFKRKQGEGIQAGAAENEDAVDVIENEIENKDVIADDNEAAADTETENGDTSGFLQPYEEYPDTGDEVLNIFDDNTEEEKARLDEQLEKFSEVTSENYEVKAQLKALDSVGKDIDKEIMALLQAEEEAMKLKESAGEVDLDFINKVTVYDTVERKTEEEEEVNNEILLAEGSGGDQIVPILLEDAARPPKKDITPIIFLSVCGVLSVLIIAFSIVTVAALKTPKPSAGENAAVPKIEQPQQLSNNANFIYINAVSQLNGENIVLQKMVMDSLATVFYFDKRFPVENYNITLADNSGAMYGMDLSYYPFGGTSEEHRTIIYFKPFEKKIKQFTLSIYDRETGDKAEYSFAVDNSDVPPARFADTTENFMTEFNGVTAVIQSAQFSTTGSTVNFSFNWKNNGESIVFGNKSANAAESGSVSLKQAAAVLPTKLKPNLYTFEDKNMIVGRMDFAPVKNLGGNVSVTFKDLFKKYELNREVGVENLLFKKEDSNVVIKIGNYDLCLDRLIYDSNKFVLVVHAEDTTVPKSDDKNVPEEYNRVEVILDVRLIASGYGGMSIPIDGMAFSRQAGSDIVFNTSDIQKILSGMDVNDFTLDIKSAAIKLDDITVNLDLSKADRKKPEEAALIEKKLISAFESRLAYKSGRIALTVVEGFSDELMSDQRLMKNYTPAEGVGEKNYSAQILTYALSDDNQVAAVVQEIWLDKQDGEDIYFYRTHKVICDFDGTNLLVVSDEILD